jgi:hypothetical protein
MCPIPQDKIETLYQKIKNEFDRIATDSDEFDKIDRSTIPEIEYDKNIKLGNSTSARNILKTGWSDPEPNQTWSLGSASSMLFRVPETSRDLVFEIHGEPFLPKPKGPQQILMWINNKLIACWTMHSIGRYSSLIFNHLIRKDRVMHLKFEYANPQSPKSQGISEDVRLLGFAVRSIKLREVF